MKANFVYSDLNLCGGGERLTLITMQAILEMGIDIDLTTLVKPDIDKLENTYGNDTASVFRNIKNENILNLYHLAYVFKHLLVDSSSCQDQIVLS